MTAEAGKLWQLTEYTNDVANAGMDGADALMLSAETAAGEFPVAVIRSMINTIISVENQADVYNKHYQLDDNDPNFYNDSIIRSACQLAQTSNAKAVVGMTVSGYTAFRLSSHRPKANIFIFTPNKSILTTMNLIWGVRGYHYDSEESTDQTFEDIKHILSDRGHIRKGDVFITMASMPLQARGRTNMMKLNIAD